MSSVIVVSSLPMITIIIGSLFLLTILLYWIFNGRLAWNNTSWAKKKRIITGVSLIITVLMVPICLLGAWDVVAINSGTLYVGDSGSVEIPPERTYKSEILSNRLAVEPVFIVFEVHIIPSFSPFTVYLCDENLPLTWHDEQDITTESRCS